MKKTILLIFIIICSCNSNDIVGVAFNTELGIITIDLYSQKAPITVKNFLRYVDENRYNDFHFYRVVNLDNQTNSSIKIEVIQGGLGFERHPNELPSIFHETTKVTQIKHLDGTISMARNKPGTASSEIFICINDQPELDYNGKRNPDGQGFAAFGRVKSGMEVVKMIQRQSSIEQILIKTIKVNSIKRI